MIAIETAIKLAKHYGLTNAEIVKCLKDVYFLHKLAAEALEEKS